MEKYEEKPVHRSNAFIVFTANCILIFKIFFLYLQIIITAQTHKRTHMPQNT